MNLKPVDSSLQKTSPHTDPAIVYQLTTELSAQASVLANHQQQLTQLTSLTEELVKTLQALHLLPPELTNAQPNPPTPITLPVLTSTSPYNSRIAFVCSLLTGRALDWAMAVWSEDHPVFPSFANFLQSFKDIFQHSSDGKEGLNADLQSELACWDEGRSLAQFIELTIHIDNLLRSRRSSRVPSMASSSANSPSSEREPMQVGYTHISPEERERDVYTRTFCLYYGLRSSCPRNAAARYVDVGCSSPEVITCSHSHKGFKHRFCIRTESVALGVMLTSGCATARHCHTEELPGVNIHCCDSDLCNSATRWRTTTLLPICSLTFSLLFQRLILWTK
ncbi:hypothetical protein Q8A67_003775 [Cirrhinus molitorella]|uniref:DUF4939 domain-containing protein n=1 Tax=Cirrhinus molitorella TaxID=172907 RepID=A0AA88TY72_9TELE|nr:hypothetical protein Q8A67_003775 [Cirrhinus molitorella]